MDLYLVKRGPRPAYHVAPFHPVIVCAKRGIAMWQAGSSSERAWVWTRDTALWNGEGFLLVRWQGLDIDYGNVVHTVELPDGMKAGFSHPHIEAEGSPWKLLHGAVWWSTKRMPEWLAQKYGVGFPSDQFTQECIARDEAYDRNRKG